MAVTRSTSSITLIEIFIYSCISDTFHTSNTSNTFTTFSIFITSTICFSSGTHNQCGIDTVCMRAALRVICCALLSIFLLDLSRRPGFASGRCTSRILINANPGPRVSLGNRLRFYAKNSCQSRAEEPIGRRGTLAVRGASTAAPLR